MKVSLKEAVKFHGHLGPYLVLGLRAGEMALRKLRCNKYFGVEVKVFGAVKKPKSCFIDGLQLSTGATYGKGNIQKYNGASVRAEFKSRINGKKTVLRFNKSLIKQLGQATTHDECERLARRLYGENLSKIFQTT
ncbi:MAG: formylmethanofuran dehydrogenase subunit E family protein [Candidatus Omnitrophica bacterium]|nr:formylmethanofuran dehydrogenase subunit E family protein [Candidatus Omnitrophota bacterium]